MPRFKSPHWFGSKGELAVCWWHREKCWINLGTSILKDVPAMYPQGSKDPQVSEVLVLMPTCKWPLAPKHPTLSPTNCDSNNERGFEVGQRIVAEGRQGGAFMVR